jgi:hypothetical protein
MLGRELGDDGRAEALTAVKEPIARHAGLIGQEPQRSADITCETRLRRMTAVAAVAAVVEQQHRETLTLLAAQLFNWLIMSNR